MARPHPVTHRRSRHPRALLVPALATTVMMTALLQTIVIPILATIGAELEASDAAVGWSVTVNLLAAAVLTPLLSRIGDLYGRRRVLIGITAAVAAGSLLAALTTSLPLLLVARTLQGSSFGLFPLSIGVLRDTLRADRLTPAMALVSGALGFGGGVGLVLTGLLTRDGGDYHRVFWLALGTALLALVLVAVTVPPDGPVRHGRVDWPGGALLGAALVAVLLPISRGAEWGWASPTTFACLGAAALLVLTLVRVERTVRDPIVALDVLANRALAITHVAGLFIGFAMFVSFLAISAFVQTPAEEGFGFSASVLTASYVYLLPAALVGVVAAPVGGRLVRHFGARRVLVLSSLAGSVGFAQLALLHTEPWHLILGGAFTNGAISMGFATLPTLVVAEVRADQTSVATGVNSIARSFGSALGSAFVVALLASGGDRPGRGLFVTVFLVGCIALLICAGVTLLLPRSATVSTRERDATTAAAEWAPPPSPGPRPDRTDARRRPPEGAAP
ncbi:MFS transporter [Aeromicrobium sp. CTD01-1L150]|uniref:MFS transporter n=1 Tax=Aeromicrobium sp. CTD01-1L150 TaxID=3341830 RepID=UPI0035BFB9EC